MVLNAQKREKALNKELTDIVRRENKLRQAAIKAKPAGWKTALEEKIPQKVYTGLESAFCKGFGVVFSQGTAIIEKSYSKENIQADHAIRDYAVQLKGRRKDLKQHQKSAKRSNFLNLTMTTVEGIGLGALGIGMPDIVLFLATLLRGIYETALNYGFDYKRRQEQFLILRMMETALTSGPDWDRKNEDTDRLLASVSGEITDEEFDRQLRATAAVFAMDMLLLKFVQGIPIVGILGGAANPFYYNKVMAYVQLKYRKQYLQNQMNIL